MPRIVKEIPQVISALTKGSPHQQKLALETYFTPSTAFTHPLCRVPSFDTISIPLIGDVNSRWVLWLVYRWYKILSPKIELTVHSAGKPIFPLFCVFCSSRFPPPIALEMIP